jgi:nucleoside 2-deoxyribosyltransferase
MKIFVAHSSNFDFKNKLYKPLRDSLLNEKHEFLLPQEKGKEVITKDIIKDCDLLLAEVSYPSTGQGIELGWANVFNVPIICIFREGSKYSSSLGLIVDKFVSYKDVKDMIKQLDKAIK